MKMRSPASFPIKVKVLVPAAAIAATLALPACGKHEGEPASTTVEGLTPVRGAAAFGSQCPFGTYDQPVSAKLQLWNCPTGLPNVELNEQLEPLIFQVDCKKKTLSVRRINRTMDTFWNLMPDGSFNITVDAGKASLKSDGSGRGACSIPVTADLSGKVDCSDRDKAVIPVEAVYWTGRNAPAPAPSPSVGPDSGPGAWAPGGANRGVTLAPESSEARCQLASSCYFYTSTTIKQCQ